MGDQKNEVDSLEGRRRETVVAEMLKEKGILGVLTEARKVAREYSYKLRIPSEKLFYNSVCHVWKLNYLLCILLTR